MANPENEQNTENKGTQAPASGIAALAAREGEIITKAEGEAADAAAAAAKSEGPGYVAPVVEQVGAAPAPTETPAEVKEEPAAPAPGPTAVTETPNDEANLEPAPAKVSAQNMVTANGSAVTNIMVKRLEKHIRHLRGELGFANLKEQHEEQVTFMETIGSSTTLEYDDFKLVTDTLLRVIIDNKDLFKSGDALRFINGLAGKYPQEHINRYEHYINFLTKVAVNWSSRHRLKSSTDIAIVIKDMKNVGKQNVTKYFNALVAAK